VRIDCLKVTILTYLYDVLEIFVVGFGQSAELFFPRCVVRHVIIAVSIKKILKCYLVIAMPVCLIPAKSIDLFLKSPLIYMRNVPIRYLYSLCPKITAL